MRGRGERDQELRDAARHLVERRAVGGGLGGGPDPGDVRLGGMLDGQLGRVQVEHAQQADQVLDADVLQLDEHAERSVQDAVVAARHVTAAPVPHLDQARRGQGAERFADRRRAHPERRGQLALGRQPAAPRVRAARDLRPQFVDDLVGDPRAPDPAGGAGQHVCRGGRLGCGPHQPATTRLTSRPTPVTSAVMTSPGCMNSCGDRK